jgi:hypothetical protein
MRITIRNDFHNTCTSIFIDPPREISKATVKRIRSELCGDDNCTCGGFLSQRGYQGDDAAGLDYIFTPARDGRVLVEVEPRR